MAQDALFPELLKDMRGLPGRAIYNANQSFFVPRFLVVEADFATLFRTPFCCARCACVHVRRFFHWLPYFSPRLSQPNAQYAASGMNGAQSSAAQARADAFFPHARYQRALDPAASRFFFNFNIFTACNVAWTRVSSSRCVLLALNWRALCPPG